MREKRISSHRKTKSLFKWLSKVTGVSACWIEGTDEQNHPVWGIIKRIAGNRFLVRSRRLAAASVLGASLTMLSPGIQAQSADSLNVSDFRGLNGFTIKGIDDNSRIGSRIIAFGDINGDGYNDLIIGAPGPDETYVVFGGSDGFDSALELSSLDGDNGFILKGNAADNERSGEAVASGDINGDGVDDVIIGAPYGTVTSDGSGREGKVYVVFGHADGFDPLMELSNLVDGTNGFVMVGEYDSFDYTGEALSSGDINGDDIDDVIINTPRNGTNYEGMVYVVFGFDDTATDTLELENLDASTSGFKIAGYEYGAYFGETLGTGDINGDGIEDVFAGVNARYTYGYSGSVAVVFGQEPTFADTVQVSALDGSDGFQIEGTLYYGNLGYSISSGDINGDGYDDIIIGAPGEDRDYNYQGEVMVIFGSSSFASVINDVSLDGTNGFFLQGLSSSAYIGQSASSADLDGDGMDDLIVGNPRINNNDGAAYVIFGFDDTSVSRFELSSLDGDNGFTLAPDDDNDDRGRMGDRVLGADIDGDSMDELIIGASNYGVEDEGAVYVFFNTMNQTITGDEGFRMLSAPTHGPVFDELLNPFFTQGFTGSDAPSFDEDNVWTWDTDTQAWTGLTNQATDSLHAGQGFLFYIFSDDSADGTPDGFPKRVSASQFGGEGSLNSGTINAVTDLADGDFFLAGNPFGFTIDWDSSAISKTNLADAIYIWDDATSSWKTWNGTAGDANEGEIAPFQGFFIEAFGGTGSLSIGDGAISDSAGVFLKQVPVEPKILKIHAEAGDFEANAWLSFQQGGQTSRDAYDGLALQPLSDAWLRLATVIDGGETLSINALPIDPSEEVSFPLDLSGTVDAEVAILSFEGLEDFTGWSIAIYDLQTEQVMEITGEHEIHLPIERVQAKQVARPGLLAPAAVKAKTDAHRFQLVLTPGTAVNNEPVSNMPTAVELHQNYPNPFNPSTTIAFGIPQTGKVTLEVFDILGRKVATLLNNENKPAGRYTLRFTAHNLASGMYIYRLQAGNTIITRKFTLIK